MWGVEGEVSPFTCKGRLAWGVVPPVGVLIDAQEAAAVDDEDEELEETTGVVLGSFSSNSVNSLTANAIAFTFSLVGFVAAVVIASVTAFRKAASCDARSATLSPDGVAVFVAVAIYDVIVVVQWIGVKVRVKRGSCASTNTLSALIHERRHNQSQVFSGMLSGLWDFHKSTTKASLFLTCCIMKMLRERSKEIAYSWRGNWGNCVKLP